ncbi:MAG: DUF2505 domain-containing protein [Solimonas sp.]
MKYEQKQTFDQPPETVLRMFGDRRYFARKYELLGFKSVEVLEHEIRGSRSRIRIRYAAGPSIPVPDFARKFIGDEVMVVQVDSWDFERCAGRIDVESRGLPARVGADMKVAAHGNGGAVNTLSWDISCSIPLLGGKLEKLLVADIKAKAEADLAASREILLDY